MTAGNDQLRSTTSRCRAPTRGEASQVDVLAAHISQRLLEATHELAGSDGDRAGPYVSADVVADELGVTAQWVREHAAELGGVQLGSGPKPRLRFDLERTLRRALKS